MDKLTELKQERSDIEKKLKELRNKAENDDISDDDFERYEELKDKYNRKNKRIKLLKEKREQKKKEVADEVERETKDNDDNEEYRKAFEKYARFGNDKRVKEMRAQVVGDATMGGYTVPETWRQSVIEDLAEVTIMRNIATVQTTAAEQNIPIDTGKPEAAWIDETGSYPEGESEFGQKSIDAWKLGVIVKASEELLQDSFIDIEDYLSGKITDSFGEKEESGFIAGDGVKKPRGVLMDSEEGVETSSSTEIDSDELIDLVHSINPKIRKNNGNMRFLMHDDIVKHLRKLKDSNDRHLWQDGLRAGEPDRLLGYPVEYSYAMPSDISNGNKVILFGDFSYYEIFDRAAMMMQRLEEKYADTGQIGFKTNMRTDGLLTKTDYVKHMVIG